MYQKQTHRHREQTCGCQREGTRKGWIGSLRLAAASYYIYLEWITTRSYSISPIALSCPGLCDPMDCSMPGSPVHSQLPELAHTHVHRVSDATQPSHPLSSPSPPAFSLSQHQGLFQGVSSLHQLAKVLELQFQHQTSNEYSRLISFRIDWFDLLAVQGTLLWYRE